MAQKRKAVKKVTNKLLGYFGGKYVTVTLKESALLGGSPVVKNVLLDVDENFYYLGANVDVEFAIPVATVMMITSGDLSFLSDNNDNTKPFGEPFQ